MSALGMCVLTFACVKWCLVKFRAVFNLLFDTLLTYLTHCCTYQQDTIFFSFSQCILIMTDVNPPLQNAQINTWIIPYREGKDGKVHSCTHTHTHKDREVLLISVPKFYTHPVTVYSFELLARDSLQLVKKLYDIQFGVFFPLKSMNATEWWTVSLHHLLWRGQGAPSA